MTEPSNADVLDDTAAALAETIRAMVDARIRELIPSIVAGAKAGIDQTYAGINRKMDGITKTLAEMLADRRAGEEWRHGPTDDEATE